MKNNLKTYLYITAGVLVTFLVGWMIYASIALKRTRAERDRWKQNSAVLMTEAEQYKVRDSLSAVRVEGLELTVRELKRFRADDAALVKDLRAKVKELSAITKAQSEAVYEIAAPIRDTIIILDSIRVPARAVHAGDEWYSFDGFVTDSTFDGQMRCRDSIVVAETVQYRRFLGFLWKTKRVKSRTVDVMSKNPHCTMQGAELITIKK